MGTLLDMAAEDMRSFIEDDEGFSTPLTFTPLVGDPFTINGLAFGVSEVYDEEGLPVLGNNSHILFSEEKVNELGYTTRKNGEVNIQKWIVEFDHRVGHVKAVLSETKPDSTLGVIKVQLSNRD